MTEEERLRAGLTRIHCMVEHLGSNITFKSIRQITTNALADGPLGDQDGPLSTPGMSKTYASPLPQGPPDPTILAIVRSGEHPNTTGDFEGDD